MVTTKSIKKRYWSWKGEHLLPMYTTTAWHVTALNSPTCSRSSTQVPTRNCQWGSVCLTLKGKDKERDCKAKSHMSHICFPAIIVQGCSGNAHPTDRSPIFASFARWPLRLSGLGMTWNAFSQTLLSTWLKPQSWLIYDELTQVDTSWHKLNVAQGALEIGTGLLALRIFTCFKLKPKQYARGCKPDRIKRVGSARATVQKDAESEQHCEQPTVKDLTVTDCKSSVSLLPNLCLISWYYWNVHGNYYLSSTASQTLTICVMRELRPPSDSLKFLPLGQ